MFVRFGPTMYVSGSLGWAVDLGWLTHHPVNCLQVVGRIGRPFKPSSFSPEVSNPFIYFATMFTSSLIAIIAFTVSVSATPNLTLRASTHNVNIDGLENLKVTTSITNTGDETLKLLNDPRGVLNTFPENTFTITNPDGSRPWFSGAKVIYLSCYLRDACAHVSDSRHKAKYSPTYAAGLNDPSVFTILDPGASVNITHDRKLDRIDRL